MQMTNSPLWVAAFFTMTLSKCRNVADSGGAARTMLVTTRRAMQEKRKPPKIQLPRSDWRNCTSSNGIARSLRNESSPFHRSSNVTSVHSIPAMPSSTNKAGSPPAGVKISRRSSSQRRTGTSVKNHRPMRMAVADVDHGSDTAIATAKMSATVASFFGLSAVQSATMAQLACTEVAPFSDDRPRSARTRLPASTSASLVSFCVSCERSASGCQRWITPVANMPSLRRTPA